MLESLSTQNPAVGGASQHTAMPVPRPDIGGVGGELPGGI